jgi:threonine-phosphate decarboxylase
MHGGNVEYLAPKYGFGIHEILDFSANMNPWGPPAKIKELLLESWKDISRYPDIESTRLRSALARLHQAYPENIVPANGISELIYWAVRFAEPGKALILAPAFSEYVQAVKSSGRTVEYDIVTNNGIVRSPMCGTAIQKFSLEQSQEISTSLHDWYDNAEPFSIVFIANPSNPCGQLYSAELLESQIKKWISWNPRTLFVIDEAFLTFVPNPDQHTLAGFALKTPQVIVLRSLTKILSIPGLRLGYAVAHSATAAKLDQLMPAWRVNIIAQKIGEKILTFSNFIKESVVLLEQVRNNFIKHLRSFQEFEVFDSAANFILIRIQSRSWDASQLTDAAGKRGILIRNCDDFVGLEKGRYIRLAVRKPEENRRLITMFKEILNGKISC